MESGDIVRGLLEKRAELVERLRQLDGERQAVAGDIEALDRALRVFDPAHRPAASASPRRRSRARPETVVPFARREMPTLIGQVLRGTDLPMTTGDIAAAIADRKNIAVDDKASRSWLTNRVTIPLNALERGQAVVGLRAVGERIVRWRAVR